MPTETSPSAAAAEETPTHEVAEVGQQLSHEDAARLGLNVHPGSEDDGWVSPEPVTLDDGSRVQLYKDGEALHAAYAAIEAAQYRICLEVYIFSDDNTGQAFADLLCRKARDGLDVYVIFDSFGSFSTKRALFDQLSHAGVRLEEFHPIRPWETRFGWRPFNRDHRKLLIVDYDVAWMGGLNIGTQYAGSWVYQSKSETCDDCWRDNAIQITGPSVRFYLRAFGATWHYVTNGGRIKGAQYTHGLDDDLNKVAFAANAEGRYLTRRHLRGKRPRPVMRGDIAVLASVASISSPLRVTIHRLLYGARKTIEMTMAYFAPDDGLVNALCDAAARGVKVRLMLPARSDVKILLVAQRAFYETLLAAGVVIYERQAVVLHAKTMVIDSNISIVGSTNLDYRSVEYNCELSSIIKSKPFGKAMHTLFENDVSYATEITADAWRKRTWLDRLVQWIVKRGRYLM